MKRRGFLKALGLAPVVAAVKPAEAERPPMRHYVDPELDDEDRATIQDTMEEMGWGKPELIDAPKEWGQPVTVENCRFEATPHIVRLSLHTSDPLANGYCPKHWSKTEVSYLGYEPVDVPWSILVCRAGRFTNVGEIVWPTCLQEPPKTVRVTHFGVDLSGVHAAGPFSTPTTISHLDQTFVVAGQLNFLLKPRPCAASRHPGSRLD